MPVTPVTSNVGSSSSTSDYAAPTSRVPQKTLGQDDFMKLLAVQFQMQDPMKPIEDTAFIAQSAQFASLEQSTAMNRQLAELRSEQQRVTANSYLGLRVTVDAGAGETLTGTVSRVTIEGGEPHLIVNDRSFSLAAVLMAERAVTSPSVPPPSGVGAG